MRGIGRVLCGFLGRYKLIWVLIIDKRNVFILVELSELVSVLKEFG